MKIRVCDICKKNPPSTKIKYKAKIENTIEWTRSVWEKIELCDECLEKIIKAKRSR